MKRNRNRKRNIVLIAVCSTIWSAFIGVFSYQLQAGTMFQKKSVTPSGSVSVVKERQGSFDEEPKIIKKNSDNRVIAHAKNRSSNKMAVSKKGQSWHIAPLVSQKVAKRPKKQTMKVAQKKVDQVELTRKELASMLMGMIKGVVESKEAQNYRSGRLKVREVAHGLANELAAVMVNYRTDDVKENREQVRKR